MSVVSYDGYKKIMMMEIVMPKSEGKENRHTIGGIQRPLAVVFFPVLEWSITFDQNEKL